MSRRLAPRRDRVGYWGFPTPLRGARARVRVRVLVGLLLVRLLERRVTLLVGARFIQGAGLRGLAERSLRVRQFGFAIRVSIRVRVSWRRRTHGNLHFERDFEGERRGGGGV